MDKRIIGLVGFVAACEVHAPAMATLPLDSLEAPVTGVGGSEGTPLPEQQRPSSGIPTPQPSQPNLGYCVLGSNGCTDAETVDFGTVTLAQTATKELALWNGGVGSDALEIDDIFVNNDVGSAPLFTVSVWRPDGMQASLETSPMDLYVGDASWIVRVTFTAGQAGTIPAEQLNVLWADTNDTMQTTVIPLAGSVVGGAYHPTEDGFIGDWLILGAFAAGDACGGDVTPFIPESGEEFVVPESGMVQADHTWREHHGAYSTCGEFCWGNTLGINLNCDMSEGTPISMGAPDNVAAYAYATVYSPTAHFARLAVGSDDNLRVWLNDAMVIDDPTACRCLDIDQSQATVTLRAGANHLLLRVGDNERHFGFTLRFLDEQGQPMTDLTIGLGEPL